jgi:hypothetical protein
MENNEFSNRMKFANINKILNLNNTTYGYAEFQVTYSGTFDCLYITFYQSGDKYVGVTEDLNGVATSVTETEKIGFVVKNENGGSTKIFYVFVNTDQNNVSEILNITLAVGKLDSASTDTSITLNYNCPTSNVNTYEMGLHVYSPYDARAGSSVLTTKLYSLTPIASWTTNTRVYSLPYFSAPALPYYYGYGSNVYKVGGEFDRAFGTKKSYTASKKLFGKLQVKENTIGPQYFLDSTLISPGKFSDKSEACVMPIYDSVGLITEVIPNSSLSQPQLYRYYMGYDPTNKRNSNDSVFTTYSFSRKAHDPVVGSTHAFQKLTSGIVQGYSTNLRPLLWPLLATAAGLGIAAATARDYVIAGVARAAFLWFNKEAMRTACDQIIYSSTMKALAAKAGTYLMVSLNIVGWALALYGIYKLLTTSVKVAFAEACKVFLHRFTTTPYINLGNTIYDFTDQTGLSNGYYCDGVYYYQQSSGTVVSKELSYTNAFLSENPLAYSFQYSLQADVPTLVTEWPKLIVLPYLSGKPMPYCNGNTIYYNTVKTTGVTYTCCALEVPNTTTITIPANTYSSCISQNAADTVATKALQNAYNWAVNNGEYCSPYKNEEVGLIDSAFTHQFKVETKPTLTTVYYDNKTSLGLTVGKKLYYDVFGCTQCLEGYYAVSGSSPYRTFYYVSGGTVQSIHTMANSNSTTVNTGQSVVTSNQDYSSNWYWSGLSYNTVFNKTEDFTRTKNFDPNTLYTNTAMKKGYAKYTGDTSSATLNQGITDDEVADFQIFTGPSSTTEAPAGWYRPLIDWIFPTPFYYYRSQTMTLNIEELCDYKTDSSAQRGFYIYGQIGSTVVPTLNQVKLSISVYVTGTTGNVLLDTIVATTNGSENKTFVPFDNTLVKSTTAIANISIDSIASPNPENKITYTIGTKSLCLANCDIKLGVDITGATNASQDNGYARLTYSGGTPEYQLYFDNWYYDGGGSSSGTSLVTNISAGAHSFKVIDANKCLNTINFSMTATAPTTVSFTSVNNVKQFLSDYIVLFCSWGSTHRFDFLTRIMSPDVGMNMRCNQFQNVYYDAIFDINPLGTKPRDRSPYDSWRRHYPYVCKPGYPTMTYYAYCTQYLYHQGRQVFPWTWDAAFTGGPLRFQATKKYAPKFDELRMSPYESFNYYDENDPLLVKTYEDQTPLMFFPNIDDDMIDLEKYKVGYSWVVINVGQIRKLYGTTGILKIDCKGRWYGDYNTKTLNPIKLTAQYYKGGYIKPYYFGSKDISQTMPYPPGDSRYDDPSYTTTIKSAEVKINEKIEAKLKRLSNYNQDDIDPYAINMTENINNRGERREFINSGTRIATLNLNLSTGEFYFLDKDPTPTL